MRYIIFILLFCLSILQAQEKLVGKIAVLQILNRQSGLSANDIAYLTTEIQSFVQLETRDSYDVITQENILTLLPPDKNLEDCVGKCEVDTGRLLGAALIITGELNKFGNEKDNLRLQLRFHETQKGTLISSMTIRGSNPNEIEKQLKNLVERLISSGLRDLKKKELEKKLGNQANIINETQDLGAFANGDDLTKKLEALKQLEQKEEISQSGKIDVDTTLKALEAEAQKKESHQKQVEAQWQQVLDLVKKGKVLISKQAVQLFIEQYHQHDLGNHRLKDAVSLMDELNIQEENEKKNALAQAHLAKVRLSYEATKEFMVKGDEQAKRALEIFLEEFEKHPLGNPLKDEALRFFEEQKRERENQEKQAHLRAVENDWEKVKPLVVEGDEKAKMALDLFLEKYKSHVLGNPLEHVARTFFEQMKSERDQRLMTAHRKSVGDEWERIRKVLGVGGPTAIKTVELFLKKYEGHALGNPFEQEAQEQLRWIGRIEWVFLQGGAFMMGNDKGLDDEKPTHRVVVQDFYMSKTEITVAQYRSCVEADICSKPNSCNWTNHIGDKENHPINCIDWYQARTFAKWVGGDLPSEAQWEYATRSRGKEIKYPWGNTVPTCSITNFEYDCHEGTTHVCSKVEGNTTQGLCDMGGNVWEWVLDEWHNSYIGSPHNDRGWCSDQYCENNAITRVIRGGGWSYNASDVESTFRIHDSPHIRNDNLGFRVSKTREYKLFEEAEAISK